MSDKSLETTGFQFPSSEQQQGGNANLIWSPQLVAWKTCKTMSEKKVFTLLPPFIFMKKRRRKN